MGLKFNNINIKPLHLIKPISYKKEVQVNAVNKKIRKLTTKSKNILKKLGYQLKHNA